MKKTALILLIVLLVSVICTSFAGCTPQGQVEIDETKTQLYVFSYDGGYGTDWLRTASKRFEDLYKNKSLEPGKTGVQVILDCEKNAVTAETIKNGTNQVYFIEGNDDYHILRNKGCFEDITSVVTTVSDYDGKTIEEKLTAEQRAYWGVDENGETHYYALPHYEGYYGIIYNVDLFDRKGFYFANEKGENSDGDFIFVGDNENKSAGPDGLLGTADDGLPATYEEFYQLCNRIADNGIVPLLWTGEVYNQYVTSLTHSFVADFEGREQMNLNYSFDGTATSLGKIVNGNFVKDTTPTVITTKNAYELSRQQGKYEAIKFTQTIATTDRFHNAEAFSTLTQLDAQERFLKSSFQSGDGLNDPCAMLVDGVWWESEATNVFNSMVQGRGEMASKTSRHFAWMYLPKANASLIGSKNVLCDVMDSKCFVRSGLDDVHKQLALDFVQFVNSDQSLQEFSVITGAPKALQYELTDDDIAKLSPYSRSLFAYKESADVIYAQNQNSLFINNQAQFDRLDGLYSTKIAGSTYKTPVKAMHDSSVDAISYFNGMYEYFKDLRIWK